MSHMQRVEVDEGAIFRRPDGLFLVVLELFEDGAVAGDLRERLDGPADWVEVVAEELATYQRLPDIRRLSQQPGEALQ
ncbi:MAG: hypothetical protein AB7G62_04745 [Magnetospirillum sp.]